MARLKFLILIPVFAAGLSLAGCGNENELVPQHEVEEQGYRRIDFEWASHEGIEAWDYFYYTDDFFNMPASQDDIPFTHASYAWAIANFPADEAEKVNFTNKSRNARALATSLGFTDFETNHAYTVRPTTDSIGLTCSRKELVVQGKITNVILLGIRGASYMSEWSSNFTLGESGSATGFTDAANQAIDFVNGFIDSHGIAGAIKIWVSGYSRAAATTNLFSGFIGEGIRSGNQVLDSRVTYGKEDIYAACFEPPAGADASLEGLHGKDFDNIKCYINPHDMAPLVAPQAFGFTRYGVQNYLPSSLRTLDYSTYEKRIVSMIDEYRRNGHPAYKPYSISQFIPISATAENGATTFGEDENKVNWPVELQMLDFVDNLANNGIGSRSYYSEKIQSGLAKTIGMVFHRSGNEASPFMATMRQLVGELLNLNLSSALIDDIMIEDLRDFFGQDFAPFLIRAFRKTLPDVPVEEIGQIAEGLSGLFTSIPYATAAEPGLTSSLINMNNISAITYAHFPEPNYFWTKAMNPLIMKNPIQWQYNRTYQQIFGSGATDIDVYDSAGNIVMRFANGKPIKLNEEYTYGIRTQSFFADNYSFFYLYFPASAPYRVEMRGPAEQSLFVDRCFFDQENGWNESIKMYDYSFEADKSIVIEVPSLPGQN